MVLTYLYDNHCLPPTSYTEYNSHKCRNILDISLICLRFTLYAFALFIVYVLRVQYYFIFRMVYTYIFIAVLMLLITDIKQ